MFLMLSIEDYLLGAQKIKTKITDKDVDDRHRQTIKTQTRDV